MKGTCGPWGASAVTVEKMTSSKRELGVQRMSGWVLLKSVALRKASLRETARPNVECSRAACTCGFTASSSSSSETCTHANYVRPSA